MAHNRNKSAPAYSSVLMDVSGGNQVLAVACNGIYVGTAGNIAFIMPGDTATRTLPFAVGVHPIGVKTFVQTGTTASNVLALYQ